jgi:putative PEP-CTERM system histidine kinase
MITANVILAGFFGYAGTAAAYLVLTLLAVRWWNGSLAGVLLTAASATTCLWTGITAYSLYARASVGHLAEALEILSRAGWILLLLGLLYWIPPVRRLTWAALISGVAVILAGLMFRAHISDHDGAGTIGLLIAAGHLSIALGGLALVENLFRNSPPARYWNIKFLCFGAGALFAYDFFLYSDAFLFRRPNLDLLMARGTTTLLLMPLLAVYASRNRKATPQVTVSRRLAFHTATLIGAGLYLISMAAAGYYVREFGGTWSGFLQAIFLVGAILLLVVPLSSGSFRAYLHVLVEKSFFRSRYDYREEWLRFIETIWGAPDPSALRVRVIEAVCNIMGSPDGVLWLKKEPNNFLLAQSWNASQWNLPAQAAIPTDSALVRFLAHAQWIVNIEQYKSTPGQYPELTNIPDWLTELSRAWLVVPLIHHERLFGIMVIGRSRVERELSWEDIDILKTVGRQAASYLAQQESDEALAEARQFEAFNKRFAFIAHDIKNLVSQLSLVLTNAVRHRDNAAFQADVIETLRQSVDKLNRMLRQLHEQPKGIEPTAAVELSVLLRDIVANRSRATDAISLKLQMNSATVVADGERLKAVVDHLVQNALDAIDQDGHVEVRLTNAGKMAAVEIEDNGPGMRPEFVRDRLFRPFDSTKDSGYGIGVYESREYARSLGGMLEVVSQPGRGTIMRMCLPRVEAVA